MARIPHRYDPTKAVYEDDLPTAKESVEAAVKQGANLTGANLDGANLDGANLTGANLDGANLDGANLTGASLFRANLDGANLDGANLDGANLTGANLFRASLFRANLDGANLDGANLDGADLDGASLDGASLPAFSHCPEVGLFTAFKRLRNDQIAVLEIPENAKRTSSLVGRKCRAEFAKVLRIESLDGAEQVHSGVSTHDRNFVYEVGSTVHPDTYCDDIRVECASGIHFFITRKEAVDYA